VQKLILYACDRNGEAYDGRGKHGVLTGCVLEHLPTPGLELDEFSRLVIQAVIALKGETQMPSNERTMWDKWCFFSTTKFLSRYLSMETLRGQLDVLETGVNKSKVYCRTALEKNGIEKEFVDAMIKKAESHPPKNPHLQRIYRSCQKVLAKMKEMRDAEQRCEAFASERKHPER